MLYRDKIKKRKCILEKENEKMRDANCDWRGEKVCETAYGYKEAVGYS